VARRLLQQQHQQQSRPAAAVAVSGTTHGDGHRRRQRAWYVSSLVVVGHHHKEEEERRGYFIFMPIFVFVVGQCCCRRRQWPFLVQRQRRIVRVHMPATLAAAEENNCTFFPATSARWTHGGVAQLLCPITRVASLHHVPSVAGSVLTANIKGENVC
jgi:hypothetical protein